MSVCILVVCWCSANAVCDFWICDEGGRTIIQELAKRNYSDQSGPLKHFVLEKMSKQ
jgi:hypothetical protein